MQRLAIPHTNLPGTSALFKDYLYGFDGVSRFYRHNPHDPEAIQRAGRAAQLPDERRRRVAAALRKINGESAGVEQLELAGTVAVVTGQQVGLIGGPCYTVYKALTAAKLAAELTAAGMRAVPVFWLATEDHDLAEVNNAWVFGPGSRPVQLEVETRGAAGQPVGGVELKESPAEAVRAALRGFPYADEAVDLVERAYQPGRNLGEAFREMLARLLKNYGLVFLDPMDPDIRELAAPILGEAWERRRELSEGLRVRGKELEAAGYHAQVLFDQTTTLFFLLEDGKRRKLGEWEIPEKDTALSPNALLRPVMQDYLLPTAVYVGGPAEVAYLAQSEVLYKALLGRMPVAMPRFGFTLADERARRIMTRFGLSLPDCWQAEPLLRERLARQLIPDSLQGAFEQTASEVRSSIERLKGELRGFDPTLAAAMEKSRAKMLYQIEKNRGKAAREALRREERVSKEAASLSGLVYPQRHLQERLYSIVPFLAKHGFELVDTLYENIDLRCPDHIVLTV